jgi:transcriptional regulator with XRE-family HTH domain
MTLEEYLTKNKLSLNAFGKAIGVTGVAVGNYVNNRRTPKKSILNKIKEATAGKVTADDFIHEGGNA